MRRGNVATYVLFGASLVQAIRKKSSSPLQLEERGHTLEIFPLQRVALEKPIDALDDEVLVLLPLRFLFLCCFLCWTKSVS